MREPDAGRRAPARRPYTPPVTDPLADRPSPPTVAPPRPAGLGEIVDAIIELYRTRGRLLLGIAALVQGPAFVLDIVLGAGLIDRLSAMVGFSVLDPPVPLPTSIPPLDQEALLGLLGVAGAMVLTSIVAGGLTTAAVAVAVAETRLGGRPTMLAALSRVVRRLGALVMTMLTVIGAVAAVVVAGLVVVSALISLAPDPASGGLAVFLGLVAAVGVVVSVAFLAARWALWPQVVLLEGRSGAAAVGRSWRVVAGSTGRVLGYGLCFSIAAGVLSQLLAQLASIGIDVATDPAGPGALVLRLLVGAGVTILMAPLVPAAMTLLYFDLRLRRGDVASPG